MNTAARVISVRQRANARIGKSKCHPHVTASKRRAHLLDLRARRFERDHSLVRVRTHGVTKVTANVKPPHSKNP
jgi:hypothetical protein